MSFSPDSASSPRVASLAISRKIGNRFVDPGDPDPRDPLSPDPSGHQSAGMTLCAPATSTPSTDFFGTR